MRRSGGRLSKTLAMSGAAVEMSGVTTSTSSGPSPGSAANCACSQSASASSSRVGVGERMKRIERSSSRNSGAPPPVFLRSASRFRIESCTRERRSVLFRSM